MEKILIKGAGDLASGIAWRLQRAGFPIIMTEIEKPLTVRLTVSYSNAVYENEVNIEGIKGKLVNSYQEAQEVIAQDKIAVIVDENADIAKEYKPDIIIDAIMAKKNINTKIDDAPIVIAVGPGFTAKKDCDYVIETKRGHFLGKVIEDGRAIKNTGVPGNIGGYTVERIIRANGEGVFKSVAKIGDFVKKGDIVAYVDDREITALIDGIVRGMLHDGIVVTDKMKCGDIDPRAEQSHCFSISDKSRAIGGGALEAVLYGLKNLRKQGKKMITIKAFWQKVQTQLKANNPVILAMVMEKKGSAPRGVGAHMLILSDGSTVDTIGGGPLEYLAIQEAKQNLKNGKSIVQTFSLNNATAGEYGMVCGGQLTVALYCLQQKDLVQVEKALTLINTKNKIVLNLSWQNENFDFKVYDLAESFALKEKLTKKSLLQMDTTNQSGQYLEIMKQSPRVYLFGGGYVAQEVAKLLPNLEFEYIVLEERSEFAKKELFPDAKRIVVVDYADFSKQVEIKNSDYVIVVTNGHTKDTLVLESLLKNPPAYIGVIGSRHKKIHVENYLAEKGFSEDLIKQIVMPIGLDIKAETPSEIAISIVAQLIQKRAQ